MRNLLFILLFLPLSLMSQYTGKVGINTEQPTKTLDVNGQVRVRDLPSGDSTDYIIVANTQGELRKVPISLLQQLNSICPYLVRSSSSGHYLLFTSSSSIPNPNDPIIVQGKNFVSAGTWISNNTYYYSYSNTTGTPINLAVSFNIQFGTITCTYTP